MSNNQPTSNSEQDDHVHHDSFVYGDEEARHQEGLLHSIGLPGLRKMLFSPALYIFIVALVLSLFIHFKVDPTWTVERVTLDTQIAEDGSRYYKFKGKPKTIENAVPIAEAQLTKTNIDQLVLNNQPIPEEEYVYESTNVNGTTIDQYYKYKSTRHWGFWSLLPAFVAIIMCWLTREPVTSLFSGIVVGAFLLGMFDLSDAVLLETMMSKSGAGILLLYLWMLGGLMGIWARTGAAKAFAELMTKYVVKGPKTARLVAWMLGIIFFQGGTMSTVLVGTTVKPIADKENISHEELSYIVDSTASPIACLLAFNAWPGYIQAFLYVSGVSFLATEHDRLRFFFQSAPLSFYAIFAVLGTFLLCIDKAPFLGKRMKAAIKRSRETGELDGPQAKPLSAKELHSSDVPAHYKPHVIDFFLPLVTLIGISIGTFIATGSPQVRWGFGAAVIVAGLLALLRGLNVTELIEGIGEGLKGVVLGSVILILAITIGSISQQTGGGIYLVELLGTSIAFWLLPTILLGLTILIAFSTGTSWGTYAVAFPLAMPLAWAVAQNSELAHPAFFMAVCFATVLNGSVIGDQCSPISDTTILSSMCTGCDLMDHVKTQVVPAGMATILAAICWTLVTLLFA
ncbi:MAG: sodium:proton antiporter [Bacteroidetes bacterium]|nr:sodium:proton antiporter [Bacteroidota bacterium]